MEFYMDLNGSIIDVPYLIWLEDGEDVKGAPCSRFAIGDEESVWLNEDGLEVEVE